MMEHYAMLSDLYLCLKGYSELRYSRKHSRRILSCEGKELVGIAQLNVPQWNTQAQSYSTRYLAFTVPCYIERILLAAIRDEK